MAIATPLAPALSSATLVDSFAGQGGAERWAVIVRQLPYGQTDALVNGPAPADADPTYVLPPFPRHHHQPVQALQALARLSKRWRPIKARGTPSA